MTQSLQAFVRFPDAYLSLCSFPTAVWPSSWPASVRNDSISEVPAGLCPQKRFCSLVPRELFLEYWALACNKAKNCNAFVMRGNSCLAGWLSWLGNRPVHRKAAGSIPSQGTYGRQLVSFSLTLVTLSVCLSVSLQNQ